MFSGPPDDGPARAGAGPSLGQWWADVDPQDADPDGYAPRAVYGRYLRFVLDAVERTAPDRVKVHRVLGRVVDVVNTGARHRSAPVSVRLQDGRHLKVDRAVLTTGHQICEPPAEQRRLEAFAAQRLQRAVHPRRQQRRPAAGHHPGGRRGRCDRARAVVLRRHGAAHPGPRRAVRGRRGRPPALPAQRAGTAAGGGLTRGPAVARPRAQPEAPRPHLPTADPHRGADPAAPRARPARLPHVRAAVPAGRDRSRVLRDHGTDARRPDVLDVDLRRPRERRRPARPAPGARPTAGAARPDRSARSGPGGARSSLRGPGVRLAAGVPRRRTDLDRRRPGGRRARQRRRAAQGRARRDPGRPRGAAGGGRLRWAVGRVARGLPGLVRAARLVPVRRAADDPPGPDPRAAGRGRPGAGGPRHPVRDGAGRLRRPVPAGGGLGPHGAGAAGRADAGPGPGPGHLRAEQAAARPRRADHLDQRVRPAAHPDRWRRGDARPVPPHRRERRSTRRCTCSGSPPNTSGGSPRSAAAGRRSGPASRRTPTRSPPTC